MHFIDEPALLSFSRFGILMGLCLIAYVGNYSNHEGYVSQDASSHAKVVDIDVGEFIVLERNQATEIVDHWVRLYIHDHARSKLHIVCSYIFLSCCISSRQYSLTVETDCVDVCSARFNANENHIGWKLVVAKHGHNVAESDVFLRLRNETHGTVGVHIRVCQIV